MRQRPAPPALATIQLLGRAGVQPVCLALLILLMLLMPVSYRARTETAHAHSILQGVVDSVTDHSHHDDVESVATPVVSPLTPANVPLRSSATDESVTSASGAPAETATLAPDIPERMVLYSPIETSSPIHKLGALAALLLAGTACAALWGSVNRPLQVCTTQDPRPSRLTS